VVGGDNIMTTTTSQSFSITYGPEPQAGTGKGAIIVLSRLVEPR
jgi:hypothetical protein